MKRTPITLLVLALASVSIMGLSACSIAAQPEMPTASSDTRELEVSDKVPDSLPPTAEELAAAEAQAEAEAAAQASQNAAEARAAINLREDFRSSFQHGPKGASYQKYIVLHDTEGDGSAQSVIDWWDGNGAGVAAHFIVNKDGSVMQCAPLDTITHHAGFGDTGHNEHFGTTDESRDDKVGTTSIGSWAADYGMNSYSIGIEMVHSGNGSYPSAQLEALDKVIAYIDAYYGFKSTIIDHKDWRSGNSDTSSAFAGYLANYKDHRTHN